MNKTAYFTVFMGLYMLTLPSVNATAPSSDDLSVPWNSTFSGINAPLISKPPLVSSGPFQVAPQPSSLQTQQQTNNPFAVSTNTNTAATQTQKATNLSVVQVLTSPNTPLSQKVNGMFTNNTTIGGQPMKVTPSTKYRKTPAAQTLARLNNISFTQERKNFAHPELFPTNPALKTAYNNFMNALKDVPSFFPLFKKIHITALHQIYLHLVGIYTSLNMTHTDDLKTYMATEKKYALNKKTLIINHLINVVMAQLNQSLRALIPGLPENYAIATGMSCVQVDKVTDPDILVVDIEQYVLSTLGLEAISNAQTSLAYNAVLQYLPLLGMQTDNNLNAALAKLNTTPFPPKNLSKEDATVLSNIMYQILSYLNKGQISSNLDAVIALLKGTNSQQPTNQQVTQLARLIAEFSYAEPLMQEIALVQKLKGMIGDGNSTVSSSLLSPEEMAGLKSILGYILGQYQTAGSQRATKVLAVLGELNPTHQTLSPSQIVQLKALALNMLGSKQKAPLMLENLSDTERSLLAYGLWVISNNNLANSLSESERTKIQTLAIPLKDHALSLAGLTKDEQIVLEKALVLFSTYTLEEDTYGTKIKAFLLAPTGKGSETYLEKAAAIVSSPDFNQIDKIAKDEQLLILKMTQGLGYFLEAPLVLHKREAAPVQYLLSHNVAYQKAFLSSISMGQYFTTVSTSALLEQTPTLSFETFVKMRPFYGMDQPGVDPLDLLLDLFTPSSEKTKTKGPHKTSYIDILLRLQKDHVQSETTAAFIKTISPADTQAYRKLFPLLVKPDFSFDQIDSGTRAALTKTLIAYKTVLAEYTTTKYTRTANNNDPTQHALETIADFLSYKEEFHSKRTSFLWVLKEYLVFFNLYAQSLQRVSKDPANPVYSGLTEFADYAKSIQQELQYESASNSAIAALVEKSNPPLFFYDPNTFRGIRLLPKLAMEIENNPIPLALAPLPSFGIEQASTATGTAIDPSNGKTVSNLATLGSFSYQKFFFLEAPDSKTEHTGSLPAWITKTAVPSSKGTAYLYEPNDKLPADGITGFYMNIPTFAKDPTNKNAMIVRLYEQPIIAQPAWLNKSGTGPKTPQTGVIPADVAGAITVLRGCLGDFQALLDLNIFDPCLTVIFSSALALSDNNLDTQTSKTLINDKKGKCAAYMKEKVALVQFQEDPKATIAANTLNSTTPSQGASLAIPAGNLNNAVPAQKQPAASGAQS